ncbi:hypothetical protein O181_089774 [Austropuccinia psidii MF-1]|uniref:Uncharacterized protein n=1 Tax=Austropuccinia psidii MF-1 TaxID=1389203 RepID=A0A9Q3IU99_9BASI|nr:hypothetical protein [Austropuccinia psidii MF-1]
MIHSLEDMIRIFCAYGLEFKDSDGLTHDWCTLIPALELDYKTSVHLPKGQTHAMSKKLKDSYVGTFVIVSLHRTNAVRVELSGEAENKQPTFPVSLIKTYQAADKELFPSRNQTPLTIPLVEQSEDKRIKEGNLGVKIHDAFEYAKQKWDKNHKVPDFKVGDLVLVSTLNFNNIKGPKKIKYSYVGTFVIVALHGTNSVQVELSFELENKHPNFPVSLIKPYQPAEKELFPLRNPAPLTVPPVEQNEEKKIKKVIKQRRLRGKNQREYLVRYRNPVHEDELLAESEITDSDTFLRRFRHERRPQA